MQKQISSSWALKCDGDSLKFPLWNFPPKIKSLKI